MLRIFALCFSWLFLCQLIRAQSAEEAQVIITLSQLFEGIRTGDTAAIRAVFHPEARIQSVFVSREGKPVLATQSVDKFVQAIGSPHDEAWEERIWGYDIQIDGNLASAWTKYTFFRGEEMSHCGANAFHLFKSGEGWKIIQVTDTRRKSGCITSSMDEKVAINQFLDQWHQAAASADEETFFGSMTIDAVYLGTDASEYWHRDDMRTWAQPYFEKDKAWVFKPKSRHIYMHANQNLAWFDELLDTWMGECRGSGVLVKTNNGWKLKHYNLAVTVPNDLMNQYIELLKTQPTKD